MPVRAPARRSGGRAAVEPLEARQLLSAVAVDEAGGASSAAARLAGLVAAPAADAAGRIATSAVSQAAVAAAFAGLTTTGRADQTLPILDEPLPDGELLPLSGQSTELIGVDALRDNPLYANVDGRGFSVVVIDTGIDRDHPYFGPDANSNGIADKIVYSYDFSGTNDADASDFSGHGSHVASVVGSVNASYPGVARGANLIALKVFADAGGGAAYADIEEALQWTVANTAAYNIAAVNLSLGSGNFQTLQTTSLSDEFQALANLNVIVAAATGNAFYTYSSQLGVTIPAADANVIAVGAVYDADFGSYNYSNGAVASVTGPDIMPPFGQRHPTLMHILAPGAPITAANHVGGNTTYQGTSQAAPHVAGAVALAQQVAAQYLGRRLTLAEMRSLMASSGVPVHDGDDEVDNVVNSNLDFRRLDVVALVEAIRALNPGAITGTLYNDANGNGLRNAGEAGLVGWTVFLDANQDGVLQSGATNSFVSGGGAQAIPDGGSLESSISVAGMAGIVADVNVTLNISHTAAGNLAVFLVAPDGTRVELFSDVGGSGDGFIATRIDDDAATPIAGAAAPFTGVFRPEGRLSDFSGNLPNGSWRLELTDGELGDSGSLSNWTLQLTTAGEPSTQTLGDGSYQFANLPPQTYTVRTQLPAGWSLSVPAAGYRTVDVDPGTIVSGQDFAALETGAPAPGAPDLAAGSDTGMDNTDNRTLRDNSSAARLLQFTVPGTVSGATVSVYADGTLLGSAVAGGASTTVITQGTAPLSNGAHSVWARQTVSGMGISPASSALALMVDTAVPTADVVDVSPDPRSSSLASLQIRFSEPVVGLDLADLQLSRGGGTNLLTAAQTLTSTDGLTWTLGNLASLTRTAGSYAVALAAAGSGIADLAGNALAFGASDTFQVLGAVAGRHVFYNNSYYDGNNVAANAADDGAIAPDKSALLPGSTANYSHYTNYNRGINGVMVDLAGVAGTPTLADFAFRLGNNNQFGAWAAAPAPSLSLRAGAGSGGSDRVTFIWPDGAIKKQWLEVTVLATARTGLASPDVFYFGNAPGEAGNSTTDAVVNALDELLARVNSRSPLNPASITFPYDYSRDRLVNATDQIIARASATNALTALVLLAPPDAAGPGAASGAATALSLPDDWLGSDDPPTARRRRGWTG